MGSGIGSGTFGIYGVEIDVSGVVDWFLVGFRQFMEQSVDGVDGVGAGVFEVFGESECFDDPPAAKREDGAVEARYPMLFPALAACEEEEGLGPVTNPCGHRGVW